MAFVSELECREEAGEAKPRSATRKKTIAAIKAAATFHDFPRVPFFAPAGNTGDALCSLEMNSRRRREDERFASSDEDGSAIIRDFCVSLANNLSGH